MSRYRDWDGRLRRVTASGRTKASATAALRVKLAEREQFHDLGEPITPDVLFSKLASVWLDEVQIDPNLSQGTKETYAQEVRTLLLPTWADFAVREITTARVDRFLKVQAGSSYARAKHARVVLNLIIKFAMRHGAIRHNPLAGLSSLRRPPAAPRALSLDELSRIRAAAREWRTSPGQPGPRPDGQVRDLIEVMLGTSARIGEALAIRKRDVDMTASPPTVHICGTLVSHKGTGVFRQAWTKTHTSDRTVAIPQFAAEVIRRRLAAIPNDEVDHLLFFTKRGTPMSPVNARRTFRQVVEHAGLGGRNISPHAFRRTVATLISQEADDQTAADMLGHAGTAVTRAHYIERRHGSNPETARILDRLAPGRGLSD